MLREHDRKLRAALLVTDIGVCGALFAAVQARTTHPGLGADGELVIAALNVAAALALPVGLRAIQNSSTRLSSLVTVGRELLLAALAGAFFLSGLAFGLGALITPTALVLGVGAQAAALGAMRLALLGGLRVARRRGRNFRNIVIIGTGPRARSLTETIESHPEWGLRIVAYADEGDTPLDARIEAKRVHKMVDFPTLLHQPTVIDEVITACPRSMLGNLGPAVQACSAAGVPLTVMTDLFGEYLPPPRIKRIGNHAALSFAPVHHSKAQLVLKRSVDVMGASLGLLVGLPILLLAALAIKLSSPGPIFFRQTRCGLHGRPFVMVKLRTMICDAEAQREELLHLNEMAGPVFKVREDPRITAVGALLRRFSIDELPQFWNVLVGDMSLVGPRPPLPVEVAQYETSDRRRLSMRPGLTCTWQVGGRNEIGFDEWVKLDLQYIDGWSLGSDLRILVLTLPAVLRGTGT